MDMKKLFRAAVLAAALALLLAGTARADEPFDENEWNAVETIAQVADIALAVPSALLMERETGTVIYELNAHERRAPASVTKVMTLLLVTEAVERGELSLDEMIPASAHAAGMGGSQIYLKENERMSADDLIKSVAVSSANDAAVALAERVAGSEEAFVSRMNARAAELGMADTVFANCTGLPSESEHLTSAWDIALMSRELLSHDLIRKYTCIWTDTIRGGEFGLSNTNKLVRFYDGATGLKTGFTQEAKYCLSAAAMRGGVEYIAVIMGADTSDIRFESAKTLLNYAFANYALTDASPAEPLPPVPVSLGTCDYIQPVVEDAGKLLVGKSELQGIERTVELEASLEAPVAVGRRVGTLTIRNAAGEILAERAVVSPEEVPRLTWGQIFVRYLRALCCLKTH